MSAQGGSLRAPVSVPVKPLLGAIAGLMLLVAIGFGIVQLGQESTVGAGSTTQVGDRFVGNRGIDRSVVDAGMRTPVQRLYADGEVGTFDIPMNGFGRIPEQRLHPIDFGATGDIPMNGFGRIPEQRLHPVDPAGEQPLPTVGFGHIPPQRLHPVQP